MSTYPTPQPITAVVDVVAGVVRFVASERADTVVDVRPFDPNRTSDVRIAEQARVDFQHGTLTVSAGRRVLSVGRGGAVDIRIELPSGSRLRASSASARVCADGAFSDCTVQSASGAFELDSIDGDLTADTSSGPITVHSATGDASVSTASGAATIGSLDGDVTFRAASGGLHIGRLQGDLSVQTASGDVHVVDAVNGNVSVQTNSGAVDLGIGEGTAARLDLRTRSGVLRNDLARADGPDDGDQSLVVHVRSGSGNVVVRRATRESTA